MPSLRDRRISVFRTPIVDNSLRSAFDVRSGLMTAQESPRSLVRNTLLAAARMAVGSVGDRTSGVSQFQRNGSAPSTGAGFVFWSFGRMLRASPVILFLRWMLPSCDSL